MIVGNSIHLDSMFSEILRDTARLHFYFQPIVDLQFGYVAGYEALVRFQGVSQTSPEYWLEQASKLGLRFELESILFRQALTLCSSLPQNCFLTLNASPQFILSSHFETMIQTVASLDRVIVEITENDAVSDYGTLLERVHKLRRLGGLLAIDDAGSGYASLKHVVELHPNFVKIDRSFVSGCDLEPAKSALIEMMGNTVGRLDAWIIAEGIETQGELEELLRLGVPLGQGYHLGLPAAQMAGIEPRITQLIQRHNSLCKTGNSLSEFVEHGITFTDQNIAESYLFQASPGSYAVLVDSLSRPRSLVERLNTGILRQRSELLKVNESSDLHQVLDRALNRDSEYRFDPLIVINGCGTYTGIIRIDRLIRHMLKCVKQEPEYRSITSSRLNEKVAS